MVIAQSAYFCPMDMIPFSPPRTDDKTVEAVTDVLLSGWITTGPKTKQLEQEISKYLDVPKSICLNSWTNACELVLRAFDVGEGDEVIIPAYTYAATANIVCHVGATPVLVDCEPGTFHIGAQGIAKKLTPRTKVVMPVDIGGLPVNYDSIKKIIAEADFQPNSEMQEALKRPLFLSDAAHSFGAIYKGYRVGKQADVCGYSFHAVKNLTTAEGGALALNLPAPFDNQDLYNQLNIKSLHGQTKDAMAKTRGGSWKYDIIEPGFKCNMTDLQAAIGLVELHRYEESLSRRKEICTNYHLGFEECSWYSPPILNDANRESSYHLFQLRIDGASEDQRDEIMQKMREEGVSTNVHFMPIPMLSYYAGMGFNLKDFPEAKAMYENEISLPVFYNLSDTQQNRVIEVCKKAVKSVL